MNDLTRPTEFGPSTDGSGSRNSGSRNSAPVTDGLLGLGTAAGRGRDDAIAGLTVHEELGHGAQAVVYRSRRYGVDYAVKVLRSAVFSEASAMTAFRREAALLACIDHPGVVSVYEVGQTRGRPYLVMELVNGQTLAQAMLAPMSTEPMPEERVVAIATDIAEALVAAHRAGLTHRDIKPGNIMIESDGRAKLIDFGLAALATATTDGAAAGTFAYTAPEQSGMLNRPVDGRSDLYSLGVVLFQCLTGRLPFTAVDVGELLRQHTVQAPPDIRHLRPAVSPALAAVIAKLLAKDPDDRYQTGDGLASDLRALAAGLLNPDELGRADGPAGAGESALIGRRDELAQLTGSWSKAEAGRGGVAVVAGSPGAGKSRLVREVLSLASAGGHLTLGGKCSADDPVPMSPIRWAVERYVEEVERLPSGERARAVDAIRRAAGRGASLLGVLSPALATLLDAPELPDEHRQEQFAVAVAAFLAGLAIEAGGAVLCVDDVQWLDAGTGRVLHHLTAELAGCPLLVVATARDDAASRPAYESFLAQYTTASDTVVTLSPLSDAAMGELFAAQLGGVALTPELTVVLTARCGGNPFTAEEYVRAIIDAGLIRPNWGVWELEEGGLDALDLPHNVLDLIGARVAGLGDEARELLVAAAAATVKIRPADLARIRDVPEAGVHAALRLAVDRRLIAAGRDGRYAFLHDRIREALLAELDAPALRALHQRIAEALDGLHPGDSEYVYAVARHYELGDLADPGRAYRAAISAGRLALLNHAPDRTLEFLDGAAAAAEAGGIVSGIEFHEPYGVACVRVGRFAEARGHLHEALAAETDPVRRAMLHGMICESYVNDWELADALSAADDALAAINRRLPGNPAVLALSTLWSFLLSLLVKWTGIGYGTATGVTRERLRIEALVLAHAAQAAVSAHRMSLVACLQFRQLYPANRIGYGPEYVKAHGTMATVVKMMGRPRLAARMFRRIKAIAAELADPRLVAGVDWYSATIETTLRNSPVDVAAVFRRLLIEHGPWLDGQQLFNAASILCNQLTQQGHTIEAQAWYDRVKARTNEVELGPSHLMTLVTVPIRSIMGSGAKVLGDSVMGSSVMGSSVMGGGEEARSQLRSAREFLATRPDNREQAVNYLMQALICAVELGDLGESFEDLAHQVEAMRLTPRNTWPAQHQIWASIAYGRLKQAQTAPGHELPARLERARIAVKRLGKAATTPMLKVHLQITRASLSLLAGDPEKAFGLLEDAERKSRGIDVPVLQFEISRVRARALQALGNPSQARQYARLALQLANECGWGSRAQAIQTEYGLSGSGAQPGTGAGAVTAEMYRHRLDALQQVSLAAVTVLDPRELARVALQETMGILGAERAFLFLVETGTEAESGTEVESSTAVDSGAEQLVPFLGRTAAGEELEKLTGYGASLVNRVRQTGEPLVVTGNEDGEAYGSQSALIHGLRSVLVAPLRLNDRLLGVVYLDSRVAKGIFTRDDVDILMAITNNIAVSLETARAAQLEAAARAAGQQRDLAERLRSSMTEVSATLDPDEVLRRLLRAAAEALPGDGACLLRSTAGGYTVVDVSGMAPAEAIGRAVDQEDLEMVTALANQPTATSGSAMPGAAMAGQPRPPAALLPDVRSWIAVPLSARRAAVGVLVVASRADDTYSDAHLQIAGALAGQGMSAYDNAELFAQVTRMATVDAMTGVSNRRHFLTLAAEAFTRLRANGQPFTAMMLDIDHFKQVNDTYGHLVGDTVIEEVGARLRSVTRNGDLLGRYGGEEFALLLTADPGHAEEAAERLLNAVRRTPIETAAGPLQLTVSIGMAHGAHGDSDLGALLARADDALYRAKQGGRNRAAAA